MNQQDLLSCVDDEPELSDEMPEDMYQMMLTLSKEEMTEALRIVVRKTKDGIRQRLMEFVNERL